MKVRKWDAVLMVGHIPDQADNRRAIPSTATGAVIVLLQAKRTEVDIFLPSGIDIT